MVDVDQLRLRPATATLEEGRHFAGYLDTAADGMFRLLLGRRFDRIIGEAYLGPGHDLSYETTVFAELDGHIVGMASAYSSAQHQMSTDAPLRKAAGVRFMRMAVLGSLATGLLSFMDDVPAGDFYLQAVAVSDDQRGAGIGSLLIDDAERQAIAAGCTRLALDVGVKNKSARALYERRGMNVVAESPSVVLTPGTGVLRMVKSLRSNAGQSTST